MNDHLTVRIVIASLTVLALAVVIGGIALTFQDKSLPGELIAIGSAAAGSVGAILARGTSDSVRVANDPDDPVPVTEHGYTEMGLLLVLVLGLILGVLLCEVGLV